MSLDRSLRGKSALVRHRNVLRRAERVDVLQDNEKWTEDKSSVFGLVKVAHRKLAAGKKPAKVEGAEGAAAPAGAKAPAGKAAAGKAAAPAGKAAPAAKAAPAKK